MLRLTASVCVLSAKWDRGGGCDGGCQVESMLLTVPVGATANVGIAEPTHLGWPPA